MGAGKCGVVATAILIATSGVGNAQTGKMVKTVHSIAGEDRPKIQLRESVLVIVDAQREYLAGPLALSDIAGPIKAIHSVLVRARKLGIPIIHIVQVGKGGGLFDPEGAGFEIIQELKPEAGETIVRKRLPNGFTGTELESIIAKLAPGRRLLFAGFMTHNCVSSTVVGALDRGIPSAIIADGVATRALPGPLGKVISARSINEAVLAGLGDRITWLVLSGDLLKD